MKQRERPCVVHAFGGELPDRVCIPVKAGSVEDVLCTEVNEIVLHEDCAEIQLKANFEAIAVLLKD